MSRYCVYVDGFNVYYALRDGFRQYKWLNYWALSEQILGPGDTLERVYYFTAYVTWHPEGQARHRVYVRALRSSGITVVLGQFKKKMATCHLCGKEYRTHEEKRTDVNIALHLLADAITDRYDRALIVSADSDLIPAIEAVHKHAAKEVGVMFPVGRRRYSQDLRQQADFTRKMTPRMLAASQFPPTIRIGTTELHRPKAWPAAPSGGG